MIRLTVPFLVFLIINFLVLSSALEDINGPGNDGQKNVDYTLIRKHHSNRASFSTTARDITTSCETKSKSNFAYGPCEETCKKFELSTFNRESKNCAATQELGCVLTPCSDFTPSLGFSCQLNKSLIEETVFICPEDEIVFDGVNIKTFDEITFRIDLDAPPVQTDVYLLADTTGSMKGAINTAKEKAKDFFRLFGSRPNTAFGVGNFGDEEELVDGFQHQQALTDNKEDVENAIDEWVLGNGLDPDEANLIALYKIATQDEIGWKQGSRRFVVLFGDSPGHEPSCQLGKAIDRNTVVEALKKKGITVVMVDFRNLNATPKSFPTSGCDGKKSAPTGQASFITKETGGSIVKSTDQSKLVALVEEALRNVIRTYTVDESDCIDFLNSKHDPSLPLVLEPTDSAVVRNTVSLKKASICDSPDKGFKCEYVYEESGAAIFGGAKIEFINVKGCDDF